MTIVSFSYEALASPSHPSSFTNKVRGWIVNDRLTAQAALARLLDEYSVLLAKTNDEYFRERIADIRDVIVRVGSQVVTSPANASAKIKAAVQDKKEAVPLLVMRDGTTYYLALQLGKA